MMEKLKFLLEGKKFVRQVISARRTLIRIGASKLSPEWATQEINNIEYAISGIRSYDDFAKYLIRKKTEITYLIPSTRRSMKEEFSRIVEQAQEIVSESLEFRSKYMRLKAERFEAF